MYSTAFTTCNEPAQSSLRLQSTSLNPNLAFSSYLCLRLPSRLFACFPSSPLLSSPLCVPVSILLTHKAPLITASMRVSDALFNYSSDSNPKTHASVITAATRPAPGVSFAFCRLSYRAAVRMLRTLIAGQMTRRQE